MNNYIIPEIDISACDDILEETCIHSINAACKTSGFFRIVGHGLGVQELDQYAIAAKNYFMQPIENKREYSRTDFALPRGYYPVTNSDLNESLYLGAFDIDFSDPYYNTDKSKMHFIPNRWPSNSSNFYNSMEECYSAFELISHKLLRILARSLGIEEYYLLNKCKKKYSGLKLVHYPHASLSLLQRSAYRISPHTDSTAFTIIRSCGHGGLEIQIDDQWVAVDNTNENSLMINIGNMLQMWTGNEWKSSMHRVRIPSFDDKDNSKLSIVFAVRPDPCVVISSPLKLITTDLGDHNNVTCGEFHLNN